MGAGGVVARGKREIGGGGERERERDGNGGERAGGWGRGERERAPALFTERTTANVFGSWPNTL